MNPKLRDSAEEAFSTGIHVQDASGDFVMMATNKEEMKAEDNPSPYNSSILDVKSLELGIDDKYIYTKITFYDQIPKKVFSLEGDRIVVIGAKVSLHKEDGSEFDILASDYGYEPIIPIPALNTYYSWGPTGIQEPEDARFAHTDDDSRVYGGPGTDYLMAAYPLKNLSIKKGDILRASLSMEAKSAKYTHAAVDVLGGVGKMPAVITWNTITGEFSVDDDFFSAQVKN